MQRYSLKLIMFIFAIAVLVLIVPSIAIADVDSGNQGVTIYRYGAIFKNVMNTIYTDNSVTYNTNPAIIDEITGLTFQTNANVSNITIISWSPSAASFSWYSQANTSQTVTIIISDTSRAGKPWTVTQDGIAIYDGSIYSNASNGLTFVYHSNTANSTFVLSLYNEPEAGGGPSGGPGGGVTTTTMITTATATSAVGNNTGYDWVPPSDHDTANILVETLPIIGPASLVLIIAAIASQSRSRNLPIVGYMMALILGAIFVIFLTISFQNGTYQQASNLIALLFLTICICIVLWILYSRQTLSGGRKPAKKGGKKRKPSPQTGDRNSDWEFKSEEKTASPWR